MYSEIGIRQIVLCKRLKSDGTNAALTDKLFPENLSLRGKTALKIKTDGIRTHRNQLIRTFAELGLEVSAYNSNLQTLANLIQNYAADGGVLAQIVTEKTSADAYGGVFNLDGANFVGFEFEFYRNTKESGCKVTLANKIPVANLAPLIASAGTNTALFADAALDVSAAYQPDLVYVYTPSSKELFRIDEIDDYSIKFIGKGVKNERTGRTIVNTVSVVIEVQALDATIKKMVEILGKNPNSNVMIHQSAPVGELIEIQTGAVSRREEFEIGDDKSFAKVIWEADLPRFSFDFSFTVPEYSKLTIKQ